MKLNLFSEKALRTRPPPISWLMKDALDTPGLISLAVGFVNHETLPTKDVLACCRAILRDEERGRAALQYGTTIGLQSLRESILTLLDEEGISTESNRVVPDHVVITTGSQSLLYLVTEVLVDPGDVVILTNPSYFVYMGVQLKAMRTHGARQTREQAPSAPTPEPAESGVHYASRCFPRPPRPCIRCPAGAAKDAGRTARRLRTDSARGNTRNV